MNELQQNLARRYAECVVGRIANLRALADAGTVHSAVLGQDAPDRAAIFAGLSQIDILRAKDERFIADMLHLSAEAAVAAQHDEDVVAEMAAWVTERIAEAT